MERTSINRSVLETSTVEFKQHFRQYLKDLALDSDPYRVELIEMLEWCFDRWEYWRKKFYPDADLMFPFFQSGRRGTEFGHYATCGNSGQPSVIHIKRSYLMGTSDTTVCKLSKTKKLILKKDHPDRLKFVDATILHELVHQYLHEASPNAADYERFESGRNNHKGHGSLFAAECNRINQILHPELGFEYVPVRHVKRDRGTIADRKRPSCAQFTHGELFFCWDPGADDLTPDQIEDNRQRLEQAIAFYNGALELVQEAEEVQSHFSAPFAPDCGDVCLQQLQMWDKANGTNLLDHFVKAVLKHAEGSSDAPVNIPPASGENGDEPTVVAIPESGPTVPTKGDGEALITLAGEYPTSDPNRSLARLNWDIRESGLSKTEFAQQRFGHKNGQQLSRHLKRLHQLVNELVAATLGAA